MRETLKKPLRTDWKDVFGGISQQKSHQKLWIQEQARGNRRDTLVPWKQGLGITELEDSPIKEFTQKMGVISASSLLASRSLKIIKIGLIMIFFFKSDHDWEVGGVS